jgi:hypothetical protein
MRDRGIAASDVRAVCYANALAAYAQSGQMTESDWLDPPPVDQRDLYNGNSVLRGQAPRVEPAPTSSSAGPTESARYIIR